MISDYQMQLLEVIKKHDPAEYKALTTKCDATIAEDHLDELAAQFKTVEDFEKSYTKES